MVMESAASGSECGKAPRKDEDQDSVYESYSESQARSQAMSAVLSWIADAEYTYTTLDEYVVAVADLDGDFELTEDEEALYQDIWQGVADALLTLGAADADVERLINGEDDAAAAVIGKALAAEMDGVEADDDDLIAAFAFGEEPVLESAVGDDHLHMVLEATYKKRKVVRDGKVTVVRKRISGKIRLSAEQKAGLRKARRKAMTGAAKLRRRKSMRKRSQRGL